MQFKARRLCFIGNILGTEGHFPACQSEIISMRFLNAGNTVIRMSSKPSRWARAREIVIGLVRHRNEIDVVLLDIFTGYYFFIADLASLLGKYLGLPIVAVLHGGSLPEFAKTYPRWTKRVLTRATALIAPSKFLATKLSEIGYAVSVLPNVIELDSYPFRQRSKIKPNLFWMRSFHPIYNPEMAIRVFAEFRKDYPNAQLTMAGNDKGSESAAKSLAKALGVHDAIRFVGFLDFDSKIAEMSAADIYLNTNRVDNMPVSVVEACALGLPVVATNVGGLPYMIEDGVNGLLVPDGDVQAMVRKLCILIEDPAIVARLSRNGRAFAARSSWDSVRPKWEQVITSAIESAKTSRSKMAGVPTHISNTNV